MLCHFTNPESKSIKKQKLKLHFRSYRSEDFDEWYQVKVLSMTSLRIARFVSNASSLAENSDFNESHSNPSYISSSSLAVHPVSNASHIASNQKHEKPRRKALEFNNDTIEDEENIDDPNMLYYWNLD